jgi:DNA-binding response OmpR family regulator
VNGLLDGMRILVLEDEFLIAMDVEQICRDHGAIDVVLARTIEQAEMAVSATAFDAAIIDLMLQGNPTLDFAGTLRDRAVPFIFASGYTDLDGYAVSFPDVQLVEKPYAGIDLVRALASACGRA